MSIWSRTFAASTALLLLLKVPVSAQTGWPSERPPRPLPATEATYPPFHLQMLANGMLVVAVPHHEQPSISMRVIVRAGSAYDPPDKLGVASLNAALLTQGTTHQTAVELNDEVDFIGAAIGAGAGNDLTFVNMVVMKDSFRRGLEIVADVLRRPAFAQEEIDRQRQQALSNLQVSLEDPAFVADSLFARLVYGFYPYGTGGSGTRETLTSITRQDLVTYHERYFVPNNTIIAVVGDITKEEAFAGVDSIFGDWPRQEVVVPTFTAPPEATRRLIIVNKADAVQTEVRVGNIGVPRGHSDYMALNLATRILGGEGANRLHQVLRTERGLTYGAQADMHALRLSGDFEASTNTRSEATGEVLRLIVDEFWRLQRERVSRRELSEAQAYLSGSFPLTIEVPDDIATQVLNVVFYGLPIQELESFRERVNAVTVDDVERVARFYFSPGRLSMVLVGDASAFVKDLKGLGFESYEVIEMNQLDLAAPDFKRSDTAGAQAVPGARGSARPGFDAKPAYRNTVATQAAADSNAEALLDRIIEAKGGYETLRAIRTITAVSIADMETARGLVATETTTYLQYPDKVRVETKLPDTAVVQVYNGKHAWVSDPSGVREVPEQSRREMASSFDRDTIAVLLGAKAGRLQIRVLPDVPNQSGERLRALEVAGLDVEPMVFYVDPRSYLIAKQTYRTRAPGASLIEEQFDDYQVVEGVQIAFTARVSRDGESVLERRLTRIRINEPLDAALFGRPSS